jgi:cyclophilin family peptidyl-prolyl cis-trans isomerase
MPPVPTAILQPMRNFLISIAVAFVAVAAVAADAPPVNTYVYLSRVYTIDKKYRSMEGPGSIEEVYVGDREHPELLWVTGVKTEMVAEDGQTPQMPELMCHVNVDVDSAKHSTMLDLKRATAQRLITLSQGMVDARFPEGFGYPIASNEPLSVFTQVLNLNIEHPDNLKVRHRVTITYIRDAELKTPIKPLFNVGASGTVILQKDDPHAHMAMNMAMADITGSDGQKLDHSTSCLTLPRAPNAVGGGASDYTNPQGQKVTGHWIVPPGHQVNHSDITWFMQLPVDTTLHFAAGHLHPFAQSLTIRDDTTGQTIFELKAKNPEKGVGLEKVDTFESEKGVPMYRAHKYSLVSVYDNPTSENADSMASAFLALADPQFVRPTPQQLAARAAMLADDDPTTAVVVRTTAGDFSVELLRRDAPAAAKSFVRLARAGAFDHARVAQLLPAGEIRLEMQPLTDVQRALKLPFANEHQAKPEEYTLFTCAENPLTFSIAAAADAVTAGRNCTTFARIGAGRGVVRIMKQAQHAEDGTVKTPIEIKKIDVYTNHEDMKVTLAPAAAPAG